MDGARNGWYDQPLERSYFLWTSQPKTIATNVTNNSPQNHDPSWLFYILHVHLAHTDARRTSKHLVCWNMFHIAKNFTCLHVLTLNPSYKLMCLKIWLMLWNNYHYIIYENIKKNFWLCVLQFKLVMRKDCFLVSQVKSYWTTCLSTVIDAQIYVRPSTHKFVPYEIWLDETQLSLTRLIWSLWA